MESNVFFTDLRTSPGNDLMTKLVRLVRRAGIEDIDFEGKFTAIKIHFGEPGNLAYIRPNYAARMADLIRSLGGKVFLTDSNTLYSGGRSNAVDHLDAAMNNGFNPISAHAEVIIADGLKGTDYREIPLGGEYCKAPKIGSAVAVMPLSVRSAVMMRYSCEPLNAGTRSTAPDWISLYMPSLSSECSKVNVQSLFRLAVISHRVGVSGLPAPTENGSALCA